MPEKPKKRSDKNMASNGKINAYFLFVKYTPEKSAAAVIGVTFGMCGTSRNIIATTTNKIMTICVLLNKDLIMMI